MKKQILITFLILISNSCFAQVNLDSLFTSIDSLALIYTGIEEEEYIDDDFYQSRCYESPFHYSTNSKDLIIETYKALDFNSTVDAYFCGFDYRIKGFKEEKKVFEMEYNSFCNYGKIGYNRFMTDTLHNFDGLKNYIRFRDTFCEFRSTELLECHMESLEKDKRIELLELQRINNLELFYRFKKTIANN
jgi:hypothetical protein